MNKPFFAVVSIAILASFWANGPAHAAAPSDMAGRPMGRPPGMAALGMAAPGMAAPGEATSDMAASDTPPPSADDSLDSDDPSASEDPTYRPVYLSVRNIVWYDAGQRGLIEAHPLVMGLAAMALATVTLLFFFLHGVKRPKDREI